MLILLRIALAAALGYVMMQVRENASLHPQTGDIANAGLLAFAVVLGIANAAAWAPYIGAKVAGPLTEPMLTGTYVDEKNRWLQLIRWFERHHLRRLTLVMCFLEGVRRPWMPTAFVIGFSHAKPGSWFEKIFAREVYRFNNTQNSLAAFQALKRHGERPPAHPNPEVDLAILAIERPPRPAATVLPVPPSEPAPPLERNARIQLFSGAASVPVSPADSAQTASPASVEEIPARSVTPSKESPPPS
ncbi:MAG: hypothetical protein HY043_07400 [Verrucomicrobia bacterium]|nr:hypothetical protein [Verrucomicrobiota bacterium]